jgi:hypothetical protein
MKLMCSIYKGYNGSFLNKLRTVKLKELLLKSMENVFS